MSDIESNTHEAKNRYSSVLSTHLDDVRKRLAMDDEEEENKKIVAKIALYQIGRRVITQKELDERFVRLGHNSISTLIK